MRFVRLNQEAFDKAWDAYKAMCLADPARLKNWSLKAISQATFKLPNPFVRVEDKTFYLIRNGASTEITKIASIAQVLGVRTEDLIEKPSIVAAKSERNLISNLNDEVLFTLIDTIINGMISNVVGNATSIDDIYINISQNLMSGKLATQVETPEAKQFFSTSLNPERADRFERNIRSVIEKALPYLGKVHSLQGRPNQTWIDTFSINAQTVSDTELQTLWSQILAGELERPGAFSLKTLKVVQDLSRQQAEFFAKFCRLVVIVGRNPPDSGSLLSLRLDQWGTDQYLHMAGITYDNLVELADYGLVNLSSRKYQTEPNTVFTYFEESYCAEFPITFLANPLSTVGRELYPLVSPTKSEDYYEAVFGMLAKKSQQARKKSV